jgi:uncharacterized membrane protein ArfB
MDFVMQWIYYLVAFGIGALIALLIVRATIKPTSEAEALAELPNPRELGGRS